MIKPHKLTLIATAFLFLPLVNAASFDDAIKSATTSGQFRFGYISHSPDVSGFKTTTGSAIGGEIKWETDKWNDFQLAI